MGYDMDFFDSFGLLLILILILVALVSMSLKMIFGIYDMIVKRKCHIYRNDNRDECDRFLRELDDKKYEILRFSTHHNRNAQEEFIIIYRRKKS